MEQSFSLPPMNAESEHFFSAAAQNRLLLKRCGACGRCHYYPRAICPLCGSADTHWTESSGRGEIYSFSVTRRGVPTPTVIAYVRLDEQVSVLTNIVDCDVDRVRIGDKVHVAFRRLDEHYALPVFVPAPSESGLVDE